MYVIFENNKILKKFDDFYDAIYFFNLLKEKYKINTLSSNHFFEINNKKYKLKKI